MLWPQNLSKRIKTEVNLACYTSFKIDCLAEYFFQPRNIKELQQVVACAKQSGKRIFILGAGSNILVGSANLEGLVLRLANRNFKQCYLKGSNIIAGSGLKLNSLILFSKKNKLSGLEFLVGIPGTVGGSLIGNAGAWGQAVGELISQVGVLDNNGKLKLLTHKQLKFAYRRSNLDKFIIIWAKFKLSPAKKEIIALKINDFILRRKHSLQITKPSAGCVFKNPAAGSAGKFLDACGLKGRVKGGAVISPHHANFILNTGCAKSSDVLSLMNLMQCKIKEKFSIQLEPEIKIWK